MLQLALTPVARRLGGGTGNTLAIAAVLVPLALLAPWLEAGTTLLPTGVLTRTLPGLIESTGLGAWSPQEAQLNDVVLQLLPWESEVRRAWSERRLPFWSDALDGGSDLWSNPQAGALSPIAWLARPFPLHSFLLVTLALKLGLALRGAGLLARRLGARELAALGGAIAFACGGGMLAWALFPLSTTVAFAPWVAVGLLRLSRHPSRAALACSALLCAGLLLSGHPECGAAGLLFALLLALFVRRQALALHRAALATAGAMLLGGALAAPLWTPLLVAVPDSQRARDRAAAPPVEDLFRLEHARQSLQMTLDGESYGRPYAQAATLWPVTSMPYCGGLVAVCVLAGWLIPGRRRRLGLLCVLWATFVFAPSWAPGLLHGPLAWIELNRGEPLGDLALCAAAALALDGLLRHPRRAHVRGAVVIAAVAAVGLGVALRPAALPGGPTTIGLAALLVPAALLCLPRWRRLAAWAIVLWSLCDLIPWARTLLPRGRTELAYPPTPALLAARQRLGANGPWRAAGVDRLIPAALLPMYGIDELRPHNPLAPANVLAGLDAAFGYRPSAASYFGTFTPGGHPLLSFLNVRLLLSDPYLPVPSGLNLCGTYGLFQLWCNREALPRWFVASAFDAVEPADVPAWIGAMRDPRRVSLSPADARLVGPGSESVAAVHAVRAKPGDVTLQLAGVGQRLLATSLPGPRGWHAEALHAEGVVAGSLATVTVNGAYLGVVVPDGEHELRLRYVPPGLVQGAFAAALAALVVARLLWPERRRLAARPAAL